MRNRVIELPAGLVGDVDADEPLLVAAAAPELIEETGFAAREMVPIGAGPIAVGVSDETVSFFQARDLTRVGAGGGDATEDDHRPRGAARRASRLSRRARRRRAWPSTRRSTPGCSWSARRVPA